MKIVEKSAEMDSREMHIIATAVFMHMVKENIKAIKKYLLNLKEKGLIDKELDKIERATGIDSQGMRKFCAIMLEPYASEIFGKPERTDYDPWIGNVSYIMLSFYVRRKGFHIFPENRAYKELENLAKITGIKSERLKVFMNIFLIAQVNETYQIVRHFP